MLAVHRLYFGCHLVGFACWSRKVSTKGMCLLSQLRAFYLLGALGFSNAFLMPSLCLDTVCFGCWVHVIHLVLASSACFSFGVSRSSRLIADKSSHGSLWLCSPFISFDKTALDKWTGKTLSTGAVISTFWLIPVIWLF